MVGLVAREAYGALALGVAFPDPDGWAESGALVPSAARALERWRASWDLPPEEGRRARADLYPDLAAGLAAQVGREALREEVALLTAGVLRAETISADGLPEHVAEGIREAVEQRSLAVEALQRGDAPGAVEAVLRGGDALREVGPEAVARALVGEVEERMGRLSPDAPYSQQDQERLRRLVRGGRQALEMGDWSLAIRRAFYAKGLLDGNA